MLKNIILYNLDWFSNVHKINFSFFEIGKIFLTRFILFTMDKI